jgi:hypothetical protein
MTTATIVLHNVDWEIYSHLRDNHANRHTRMAYLDGDLTLMSPQFTEELSTRLPTSP